MPELPEVETIRRQLEKEIKNTIIKKVVVNFSGRLNLPVKKFIRLITRKKFLAVNRRAKLLIFELSGGLKLLAHLKMTGRFVIENNSVSLSHGRRGEGLERGKHTHVVFELSSGKILVWSDFRKFGFLKLLSSIEAEKFVEKQNYGPEPLDKKFTWIKMAMCLRSKPKAKTKPHLLDQTCIAGVGNIYATEALWMAKIHPLTAVGKINDQKMRALHRSLITILKKSIICGGASADTYVDAYGRQGAFEKRLKVYGREGKTCPRCKTKLIKLKIAGRGSVICPRCQQNS
jgi:formamidopyrimidine-DNA glycosylase